MRQNIIKFPGKNKRLPPVTLTLGRLTHKDLFFAPLSNRAQLWEDKRSLIKKLVSQS